MMDDLIGQTIGHYEVLELIGEGGMATVYKARDVRLNRDVALKMMHTNARRPEVALARFDREARILAKLNHPNIVRIIEYGEHENGPYFVMDYLAGGTLRNMMTGPIQWETALQLILPVVRALEHAHAQQIIHRDIKPTNILMGENGVPMLSDFGIARINEDFATMDLTGAAGVGTPDYMAPEQLSENQATEKSDLYAVGVVLYEMITGTKPFTAQTPAGIIVKQISMKVVRPGEIIKDLPSAVEDLLLQLLAKSPGMRLSSMGELAVSMEELLRSKSLPVRRGRRRSIAGPLRAGLIALGILGAGAVVVGLVGRTFLRDGGNTPDVNATFASPGIVNTPAVGANSLYHDDFSDPASGWSTDTSGGNLMEYSEGGYRIEVNQPQVDVWSVSNIDLRETVRISVDARKLGGPENNNFGILCRFSKSGNVFSYYFFIISSEGHSAIGIVDRNNRTLLEQSSAPSDAILRGESSNRINVLCGDDGLTLSVNGVEILSTQDNTLSSGLVGLIAGTFSEPGTDILFDNFEVGRP